MPSYSPGPSASAFEELAGASAEPIPGAEGLSPARIRTHLDRVLSSPDFAKSERMRRFLCYVVEARLEGKVDCFKEISIGVAVFDRDSDFDPKTNPIVRVEARRLRDKLRDYYASHGSAETIVIHLPKGAYTPRFEEIEPAKIIAAETAPALAIEPLLSGETSSPAAIPVAAPAVDTAWMAQPGFPWLRLFAGLSMLMISVVALVWVGTRRKSEPLLYTHTTPLTSYPGREFEGAFSPDGTRIAFVWDGPDGGSYNLYVKGLDRGAPVRITNNPEHDLYPAWSPDGRSIAFLRVREVGIDVMIVSAQGGSGRKVGELHITPRMWAADPAQLLGIPGPTWTPDGKYLLVTDELPKTSGYGLYAVSINSGERRTLTSPSGIMRDFNPAVSPDGRTIAFVRETSHSAADIFVADLAADWKVGELRRITFEHMDIRGICWMPDGKSIVYASNRAGSYNLWRVSKSGDTTEPIPANGAQVIGPAVSKTGNMLYTDVIQNTNIWRLALQGSNATHGQGEKIIASSRHNDAAQYSPDGRWIAFASDRSGAWEIWITDANGGAPRQLTSFAGPMVGTPHWSTDSRTIVFDARPSGHSAIFAVGIDGGPARQAVQDVFENRMPNWSGDGKWIYFNSDRGGIVQLWKAPVNGGPAVQVTKHLCRDSYESPDGRYVYFLTDGPGIWQVPSAGGEETVIPELAQARPSRHLAVTRDGIYFLNHENAPRLIQIFRFATRRIETVASPAKELVYGTSSLSVSPDARWLIYAQEDESASDLMLRR